MGRFSTSRGLNEQFEDAIPQFTAKQLAEDTAVINETWLKNNAFNTETYEEIFSLPQNKYYSLTFGDIEHLKDLASEAPVIRLVNLIINHALERRASDIHK